MDTRAYRRLKRNKGPAPLVQQMRFKLPLNVLILAFVIPTVLSVWFLFFLLLLLLLAGGSQRESRFEKARHSSVIKFISEINRAVWWDIRGFNRWPVK